MSRSLNSSLFVAGLLSVAPFTVLGDPAAGAGAPVCDLLDWDPQTLTWESIRSAFEASGEFDPDECDLSNVSAERVVAFSGRMGELALDRIGLPADVPVSTARLGSTPFASAALHAGQGAAMAALRQGVPGPGGAKIAIRQPDDCDQQASGGASQGGCGEIPGPCSPAMGGPYGWTCQNYWLLAGIALFVVQASSEAAAWAAEQGEEAHDDAREAEDGNYVPAVLPASHSQTLKSKAGEGEWEIIVDPLDPLAGGPTPPPCDVCKYLVITLGPLPDSGYATQAANYYSINPGPQPWAWLNEPPEWKEQKGKRNWWKCGAAIGIGVAAIGMGVASAGAASTAAAVAWAAGAGGAEIVSGGMMIAGWCERPVKMVYHPGRWAANGSYWNSWHSSDWTGEVLNVLDILRLHTHIDVFGGLQTPFVPLDTAPPYEGWAEMRQEYRDRDAKIRADSWGLHNTWGHVLDRAWALLQLDLHLIVSNDFSWPVGPIVPLGGNQGWNFYSRANIVIGECATCTDQDITVLYINSPGTGEVTPSGDSVTITFLGDKGAARLNVAGITLPLKFTLDGTMQAEVTAGGETHDV